LYKDYKPENYDELMFIYKYIKNNNYNTLFSDAHILDLIPKDKNQMNFYKNDERIINKLTKKKYLYFDYYNSKFFINTINPKTVYKNLYKNYDFVLDFNNILKETEILGFSLADILDNINIQIPENANINTIKDISLLEIMSSSINDNNKSIMDPKTYRKRRNENMKNDSSGILNLFKKELEMDNFHNFSQFYYSFVNLCVDSFRTIYDHTNVIFLLLDQIYYATDKEQKNIQLDAQHSANAAIIRSKYFLTQDDRLIKKAKIAYSILNIDTMPIKIDQFIQEVQ